MRIVPEDRSERLAFDSEPVSEARKSTNTQDCEFEHDSDRKLVMSEHESCGHERQVLNQ